MMAVMITMTAFAHSLPGLLAQLQTYTSPPGADYMRILPELVLSIFGMMIMVVDPLLDEDSSHKPLGTIALIGALAALASTFWMAQYPGTAFWNMVRVEDFSVFFHFLVIAIAAVVILSSYEYLPVQRIRAGEYYGLILFGTVGMCLMSSAIELVLIFIALEISSISTYVLAGFRRRDAASSESSLKYFLLGSFATAFFLYGVALMFGATGSTNIDAISQALHSGGVPVPVLAYVATALMFVGLGFKVASAPFHVWTPDVYEGAPAPIVGLMSTGPKAAAFAVLLRVMFEANAPGRFWLIWVSAALSMTLGNLGALVQDNVKRLLAYSSIAHAGYLLVAFAANRAGRVRGDVLHRRLCCDERRSICRGQPLRERGRKVRHARRLRGPGQEVPRAGRDFHILPDVFDRHSDHRRLLRQVLRVECRAEVESGGLGDHSGAE